VSPPHAARSTWTPLRHATFRWLWIATLASNIGTWFQNVGASWQMTTLTRSATLIALVQAATSLPSFLLALPAGAVADVVDRRRLLLVTQGWMTVAAAALAVVALLGLTTPWLLLAFTFLLGLGAAANGPAWQATVPEMVPRPELAAAITLNSIGFNLARAAGPALAGLIVAAFGPGWTYLLNALSFVGVLAVLYRWRREPDERILPSERFFSAMRAGLRYVRHAPDVRAPIVRGSTFIICGSALWALLPLVARAQGQGATGYGLLLAALGAGAVSGAMVLPLVKQRLSLAALVPVATVVFALAITGLAQLDSFPLHLLAMFLAGGAWLTLLSTFNVAVQTVVPSWVRARAVSIYLVIFYGALAGGSWLWGAVAEFRSVSWALSAAAVGMVIGLAATWRFKLRSGDGLNLAPSRQMPAPLVVLDLEDDRGPVMVTVRYQVRSERAEDFGTAMRAVREIRLRNGATEWGLFVDSEAPEHYTEVFFVQSWLEHLRQHERVTVSEEDITAQARAFHVGDGRPAVHHLIAVPLRSKARGTEG
jgi:MFS family permease